MMLLSGLCALPFATSRPHGTSGCWCACRGWRNSLSEVYAWSASCLAGWLQHAVCHLALSFRCQRARDDTLLAIHAAVKSAGGRKAFTVWICCLADGSSDQEEATMMVQLVRIRQAAAAWVEGDAQELPTAGAAGRMVESLPGTQWLPFTSQVHCILKCNPSLF
jgi:hypothetical protein